MNKLEDLSKNIIIFVLTQILCSDRIQALLLFVTKLELIRKKNIEKTLSNKIKCSHILVQKQSESLAILERIKNGEKFGKLAKELSIDSGSAKKDGNLGYFTKGMMVKPFEEVAFKLQVGEISEPVKTEFGYHIIKRLG